MRDYRCNYGEKMRDQIKEWFIKHPEYRRIYGRKWRGLNKQYYKKWKKENHDLYVKYQKEWHAKNRAYYNEYMKKYMKIKRQRNNKPLLN